MNLSRRGIVGALAGAPFAARLGTRPGASPPSATMGLGAQIGQGFAGDLNVANKPKMEQWQAMRLALLDPDIKALWEGYIYAQNRIVHEIDPDIAVMRSFSPMAKLTFQRQRNVSRSLQESTEPPVYDFMDKVQDYLHKLMWGAV